ncbi:MAG: MFS transporter [Proteobacteria bacterium]|nr:MFS transporter [Pseudomonadota bacterium]MBU1388420.1 MFS transporter [Pseudomonadota bacterium]MBU1542756.1 MFS transporter [Pseudomonadota bacterium]MBU2482153.1 MFS transporter [Pseudomonadota bacterium]
MNLISRSPFEVQNIRLFIAFRVFFNSRFYYPVFTILFLDFGLTVAQFSILNAAWAATIVLAEVPSGALADIVGRKRLLVFATATMIIEIGIIAFIPRTDPDIIFMVFLVNRILSGLAEAAASGADEAIAYDSLAKEGLCDEWGKVLEVLTRFQSIGFIIAMSVGAAVYDPGLMEKLCQFAGFPQTFAQETTMRFPLYLTFALALCAFVTTLKMKDPNPGASGTHASKIGPALKMTLDAGRWIFKTPFALSVILFGMMFDGIIRMIITLSSQYYRIIDLPESVFGLIGSLVAVLGLVIPKIANKIAQDTPPATAVWVTTGFAVTGLFSMNLFLPYLGIIPAIITFTAMYFNGFFVSFYMNRTAPSHIRATVLSFKGLAYNISYGVLGVLYAMVLKAAKQSIETFDTENLVFTHTFFWFPAGFVIWFVVLLAVYRLWLKKAGA